MRMHQYGIIWIFKAIIYNYCIIKCNISLYNLQKFICDIWINFHSFISSLQLTKKSPPEAWGAVCRMGVLYHFPEIPLFLYHPSSFVFFQDLLFYFLTLCCKKTLVIYFIIPSESFLYAVDIYGNFWFLVINSLLNRNLEYIELIL